MGSNSEPKAGAVAVPPPRIGKREGENGDEKQVSAKKLKRDEVTEEQKNKEGIVSDDSFSDSVPDKNPEAEKGSLSKQEKKGKPSSVNCSSSLESLADGSEKDEPKPLASSKEQNAGSKTICTRNLSYSVERADLENLFKECGEIVDVRLHTDLLGRFRGFGHVEFATAEAAHKALQLNNTELLRCPIRVVIAREKRKYTPNRSFHVNFSNSFQRSERTQPVKGSENCERETEEKASETCQKCPKMLATWKEQNATSKTIYARNLPYSVEQADMEFHFKECGEIVDIRLHKDHKGWSKGYGHVEFATEEAGKKALKLNNTVLLGRHIGVDIAQEKGEYTSNRSNWSKSFHKSDRTQPIRNTESSEYWEEEIEKKSSKCPWESDVEMVGASSIEKKASKMLGTWKEQNAPSKTIFVRNLSYRVEQADMENLFKECGKIVDVRLHTNREGRLNGFGQVEFATAEAAQKATELNNTELLRRPIRVDLAREKGEYTYSRSNWRNSFEKCERNQSSTVFVKGFDSSLTEKKIKAILEEHFGSCGEIARISIPKFHDSDAVKGFAHLEFKDVDSVKKALHLDQTELGGYPLLVEKAKPRRDNQGLGGERGGGHQFGGRDGSGYSSKVGWGRSGGGGGGWHSSFFDEGTGRKNHFY